MHVEFFERYTNKKKSKVELFITAKSPALQCTYELWTDLNNPNMVFLIRTMLYAAQKTIELLYHKVLKKFRNVGFLGIGKVL